MDCKDMAMFSARVLDNKKARIDVINIGTKAAFADYMVLASGGSERQIETLADELEEQFQKEGIQVRNIEGKSFRMDSDGLRRYYRQSADRGHARKI